MTLAKVIGAGLASAGALAFVSASVNAADLYAGGYKDAPPLYAPPPGPMWTGFYVGGHLGADWWNQKTGVNIWDDGDPLDTSPSFGGKSLTSNGAFAGGQFGYNWQTGNFVLGFEADLGGMGNKSERSYSLTALDGAGALIENTAAIRVTTQGGFYGDITGRLGYAVGPALFYAKGGFAWLDATFKTSALITESAVPPVPLAVTTSLSESRNVFLDGWTAGGGLEYMLSPNWTMKLEYLHFDFYNAGNSFTLDSNNAWELTGKNLNVDSVKLGFNYLFNHNSYAPLK